MTTSHPLPPLSPLCVYCGSADGNRPDYPLAAAAMGTAIAKAGITLIYGGGRKGLMGHVAQGALDHGGHVIGIITQQLVDMETAHTGLRDLRIVATMHERKMIMASESRAFIALPGGVGTLDELFEILAWSQLGLHHSPVGLLNVAGFFDPLITVIERMQQEGFLRLKPERVLAIDADPARLLAKMAALTSDSLGA